MPKSYGVRVFANTLRVSRTRRIDGEYRTEAALYDVQMEVDVDRLMQMLATKAAFNKSKRSTIAWRYCRAKVSKQETAP